jgi:hypothetical protein
LAPAQDDDPFVVPDEMERRQCRQGASAVAAKTGRRSDAALERLHDVDVLEDLRLARQLNACLLEAREAVALTRRKDAVALLAGGGERSPSRPLTCETRTMPMICAASRSSSTSTPRPLLAGEPDGLAVLVGQLEVGGSPALLDHSFGSHSSTRSRNRDSPAASSASSRLV